MQERGRTQEKGTKPFRGETRFEAINVNQPLNLAHRIGTLRGIFDQNSCMLTFFRHTSEQNVPC
jgi:hypothetical protein